MVPADIVSPVVLVGREIRIECTMVLGASRGLRLVQRLRDELLLDTGQRPDDLAIVDRRKADAFLRSVQMGAVRR